MADHDSELEGPDLAEGVPRVDLEAGDPLLGHFDGQPVLLVPDDDGVHAIGASCTHYGGPLQDGLVKDGTVRCPWHHACFSLATGEAIGAPALNPLPRWEVDIRNGVVHLGAKKEPGPLDARGRRATGPETVVIVGAGAAGSAAAEMLRREGHEGRVLLVDPDVSAPYDRPNLSKDYLAGSAPEEWIPLRPEGFYEEHGIERVTGAAEEIEPKERSVRLSDGRILSYDALLLATGATPRSLPVPGADDPRVCLLRSLDDCKAIIERAEEADRAVIVGASFIGMESAWALRRRGLEVTVVAPEELPFARTLGEALGRMLKKLHEENGVEFRLGRSVERIDDDGVHLDDGSVLPAPLVVAGVGVEPDLRLARSAGLRIDDGVVVDGYLESSVPGIFAAGDIANWPDPVSGRRIRVEHWAVAQNLGQTAARNILGRDTPFRAPPFFWTQHYDLPVAMVGHNVGWDAVEVEGEPEEHDAEVRYLKDGRTLAVATVFRDMASLRAEAAMEDHALAGRTGGS